MDTLSPVTLAAMLKEAFDPNNNDNDRMDTLWWVIDELEGKHENTTA
jgi:hypothetical protein